ncbi:MAG: hypothetical protein KIS67_00455 [Verrucomicrobiae bacterium]|nr:hypothetical protein [Verrucomicrobiae bacterium]
MATCLLLPLNPAAGQSRQLQMSDEYMPRQYTKDHGLPDDEVRNILQTRDGYLWIVTQQGLARFDGKQFVIFDHANSPEIDEDSLLNLAEDRAGNLWIGARDYFLRREGNSFHRLPRRLDRRGHHTPRIVPSRHGGIWASSHGGVAHVTGSNIALLPTGQGWSPADTIFALQEDHDGVLWVGTRAGLHRFDSEQQRFEKSPPASLPRRAPISVTALHRGSEQALWAIFAELDPLLVFNCTNALVGRRTGGQWNAVSPSNAFSFDLSVAASFILQDSRRDVWLSASLQVIHRLHHAQFDVLALPLPHSDDRVLSLHEDHEGNLWMGTGRSGLWRWQPRKLKTYTTREGLPDENAWVVCEAPDGAVWMGTDGGVSRLHENRLETWTTEHGLARDYIRAVAVAADGTVWIGTSSGLNSWRDGQLKHHPFPGEWFEGKIRALLPARDGALWVAAATGLNLLHGEQRTQFTITNGLAHNDVRALLEDREGRLWIGTYGAGLQSYYDGQFKTYSTNDGLSNNFVWALHEDAEGALWVGTASGLNRLRDEQFTVFNTHHELPDNLVNFILEDDLGQLWISHDRGIYRARLAALNDVAEGRATRVQCVSYTTADGLPSDETNGQKSYPAGCKTRDGRLWFPTTRGVAVFDPKLHREELAPPKPVIEQIRATGELVYDLNPRDPFAANQTRTLEQRAGVFQLPAGSGRVLEFDFTANTFVSAEKSRFRCRLLGMGERWIDLGTRREAFFTNLKPGNYRFEVVAANHHGVWQETPAVFAFYLAPFFHETVWFRGGTVAVLLLGAAGVYAWRVRELRRIQRLEQQAALNRERARIAKDLHDGLGADLTQISLLADLAEAEHPAAGSPESRLRNLSAASKQMAQALKDIIWSANPADTTLDGVVAHICQYAETFLNAAQIACRFDVPDDLPSRPLSVTERQNLFLVTKEALSNVARHAQATEVWIRVAIHDATLALAIENNGRGFGNAGVNADSTGRGLPNMRQRMAAVGGELRVEPLPERGTRVSLTLQL